VEIQLRAGHPDVEGLCLALADWSAELRLLTRNQQPHWRSEETSTAASRAFGAKRCALRRSKV